MIGDERGFDWEDFLDTRPKDSRDIWHTHPDVGDTVMDNMREERFSGYPNVPGSGDRNTAHAADVAVFLNTPRGRNAVYDPRLDPPERDLPNRDPKACECVQ